MNRLHIDVMVPQCKGDINRSFLEKICEPYLEPFRKFIPPLGMIDLSPLVALLVLNFASGYGIYYLQTLIG